MKDNKYYIISFSREALTENDITVLTDRVKRIGSHFKIGIDLYLVKTPMTAKEIYDGFSKPPYEYTTVFIAEIKPSEMNIWGFTTPDVWKFLDVTPKKEGKEAESSK